PLADILQEAGQRGSYNISKQPDTTIGKTRRYRAFQRDQYIMGFHDVIPVEFGSFTRDDSKFAARRLVYTSTDMELELSFRRGRSSTGRQAVRPVSRPPVQMSMLPGLKPDHGPLRWRAALLWDCPTDTGIHSADQAMPFRLQLAAEGTALDDHQWIDGFPIRPELEDLIPSVAQYSKDEPDWEIDDESGAL